VGSDTPILLAKMAAFSASSPRLAPLLEGLYSAFVRGMVYPFNDYMLTCALLAGTFTPLQVFHPAIALKESEKTQAIHETVCGPLKAKLALLSKAVLVSVMDTSPWALH
jgi:hypothetical protein